MGVNPIPSLSPPRGRVARLVGPWSCRRCLLHRFVSLWSFLRARGRRRNRQHRGARLLFAEYWEWGLNEEARNVFLSFSSYSPRGTAPRTLLRAIGANPHYHIVRPSERGRLPMFGATLEPWHSRVMRVDVEGVKGPFPVGYDYLVYRVHC